MLNQRVPNEFTSTLPIIASRLMTKNTTSAQTAIDHSLSPMLRRMPVSPCHCWPDRGTEDVRAASNATMITICTAAISIAIADASE